MIVDGLEVPPKRSPKNRADERFDAATALANATRRLAVFPTLAEMDEPDGLLQAYVDALLRCSICYSQPAEWIGPIGGWLSEADGETFLRRLRAYKKSLMGISIGSGR